MLTWYIAVTALTQTKRRAIRVPPTMDFHTNHHTTASPSSSSSSSTPNLNSATTTATTSATNNDPMHSWWESISKARSCIHSLSSILPSSSLSSLADSDRPARSLLDSPDAYAAFSDSLSSSLSGTGSDPLCQWLYETFQSSDPDLRLVVLSFIPLLAGLYLSRIISNASDSATIPSLAGFEAVLLAIYAAETKARAGKPVLISIADLSLPSLYHSPRNKPVSSAANHSPRPSVGVLSAPLEPQNAVKSTKRACIVGVALDCYYKQISQMPTWSKVDLCEFAAAWAGQDCSCKGEFDKDDFEIHGFSNGIVRDGFDNETDDVVEEMDQLKLTESNHTNFSSKGARIPLPWELFQPVVRILGHCLLGPLNSDDVKDAASIAIRCLYARASHDLIPQAILATRSLIQLDNRSRATKRTAAANAASNANTPSKAKKPEILLVSK